MNNSVKIRFLYNLRHHIFISATIYRVPELSFSSTSEIERSQFSWEEDIIHIQDLAEVTPTKVWLTG